MNEPLEPRETKSIVRSILATGAVRFSSHALLEMKTDHLVERDVLNVLHAGLMKMPAEFEHGTWRYRIETTRIAVVIAFRSETVLVVVTAWRY